MTAESWGRVNRGTVWHLVTGPDSALCDGGLYGADGSSVAYSEVSAGLPPAGGRPCPRCCAAVDDLAFTVINAVGQQQLRLPAGRTHLALAARTVEDVDLLTDEDVDCLAAIMLAGPADLDAADVEEGS